MSERRYSEEYFEVMFGKLGTVEFQIEEFNYGRRACAAFVSNVLKISNFIDKECGKIIELESKLKMCGWSEIPISEIRMGDIVIWEPNSFGIYHIGFYLGNFGSLKMAISNDSHMCVPVKHSLEIVVLRRKTSEIKKIRRPIKAYGLVN